MISSVRGEVLAIGLDHAVVEVGGVGLAVVAAPATLAGLRRGESARLHTSLVVREDSLTLFGFVEVEARELFVLLQSAPGIGPRVALAILAVLDPDTLRRAVHDDDVATLTRVPGIGRKTAEKMVIELRDKVDTPAAGTTSTTSTTTQAGADPRRAHVVEALVGLGFTAKPAEAAVDRALAAAADADASALLRAALASLSR